MKSDFDESVFHSKLLVNYFKEICKNFSPPYKCDSTLVNANRTAVNRKLVFFLSQVNRLVKEKKCDLNTFKSEILNISRPELVHLEVFWYLDAYKLLTLGEIINYIESANDEDIIERISTSLYDHIEQFKPNQSHLRQKLLKSYFSALFDSDKIYLKDDSVKSISAIIINKISCSFVEMYKTDSLYNQFFEKKLELANFIELLNEANMRTSSVSVIFSYIVNSVLQGASDTLKSVLIRLHSKPNYKQENIYKFFAAVSKFCEFDCLINQLNNLLLNESKTINWNNMLPYIVFIGSNYPDGWKKIKNTCDLILRQSFQSLNRKLLYYVFIIARQGCFEKPKGAFPTYLQWFGSAFSSKSSTPIKSFKVCQFLFSFLTELTQFDSVQYLKVHINRTPLVPSECQCIVTDYVKLVKNRLCDLNASTELGICENTTGKSAAAYDVEAVMKHFEESNTIMSSVFQSAMFNKSYYEKKFLVELLSKFDGKNSTRHKLILKLNSLGKVPKSIFKKYQALEKNALSNSNNAK